MSLVADLGIQWVEQGKVPDPVVRAGIRHLLKERLAEIGAGDVQLAQQMATAFMASLGAEPIALLTDKANEQHYEVPAAFFHAVLGQHRKYSSCYWGGPDSDQAQSLEEAEVLALRQTCQHADLVDGQDILELGCGWGSLTLWMAQHFPKCRITAVSNSHSQRAFIEAEAAKRGLANVTVITCDMNAFETPLRFDRIVSVEMFEHMRNWPSLMQRVAGWLVPGGKFFMHVFVHRSTPYAFIERDSSDWMSRFFFSGGMMPSDDMAVHFQDHLKLMQRWRWDGTHYERTSNAWLANMDAQRATIQPILDATYGTEHAEVWRNRWRIFFMSVAELFGYGDGQQWWISHYLFERRA